MGSISHIKVGFICGTVVMITLCTWIECTGLTDCVLGSWSGVLTGSKEFRDGEIIFEDEFFHCRQLNLNLETLFYSCEIGTDYRIKLLNSYLTLLSFLFGS